jgi:hypothetical protein
MKNLKKQRETEKRQRSKKKQEIKTGIEKEECRLACWGYCSRLKRRYRVVKGNFVVTGPLLIPSRSFHDYLPSILSQRSCK